MNMVNVANNISPASSIVVATSNTANNIAIYIEDIHKAWHHATTLKIEQI